MSMTSRLMAVCCVGLMAGPALAAGYGARADSSGGGSSMSSNIPGGRLTTADGMSLYVFDKDSNGKSNCYEECAVEWPPMTAAADATPSNPNLSVVRREDGTSQWAWIGRPLYLFDEDKARGDINGDGYSPDWHLALSKH